MYGLFIHMFLKTVHDTEGKKLNCHDPCLKPGLVSGAGIQKAECFSVLKKLTPLWEMQFLISCHSLSCGLGAQVFRFSTILRKIKNPDFMFPYKQFFQFLNVGN